MILKIPFVILIIRINQVAVFGFVDLKDAISNNQFYPKITANNDFDYGSYSDTEPILADFIKKGCYAFK